jgi:hypothetical protein
MANLVMGIDDSYLECILLIATQQFILIVMNK